MLERLKIVIASLRLTLIKINISQFGRIFIRFDRNGTLASIENRVCLLQLRIAGIFGQSPNRS